ncbi:unnamed protein product [Didymodactylos carnosus]|uniref:PLAT domain-containing protein n=1 Tax=Didymodactylos carnosus TaxID=1234261 RepID=A0A814FF40_9BILA|nr:unnamed protein product [Didymodactylos carnosus]CAF0982455.1 unnamed protein product [Didymodactylos carnosus]CAF3588490.1 unnamed protein product [Didymodactylos carnosus]CAF3754951.1 unnamed protein product [Didymodactylos carnosus]
MALDTLNRKLAVCAAVFAGIGVVMAVISMATNYWTIGFDYENGNRMVKKAHWSGLFYSCTAAQCNFGYLPSSISTFVLCLIGSLFMLAGAIFSGLMMGFLNFPRIRYFLAPLFLFIACVFITAGLFDFASSSRINSHSSRLMIATIVFGYCALAIASFVAGRYTILTRNPKQYQQTGAEQERHPLGYIHFEIRTANEQGAGTDSNIYASLIAEYGNHTRRLLTATGVINQFERNSINTVVWRKIENLGKIKNIELYNDGKWGGSAWRPTCIYISCSGTVNITQWLNGGDTYTFPVDENPDQVCY